MDVQRCEGLFSGQGWKDVYTSMRVALHQDSTFTCCSVLRVHGLLWWSCGMWFKTSSFNKYQISVYRNNNIIGSCGEESLKCANLTK